MSDRPYSPDERMLQLLGEGTRTPLLPPATLPSAPSLWNTSTPSSEPPAVYLIVQVVVLKVSLHYKVCTGKVKKHLTKMEAHGCNSGKKIMVVCIIKHTMASIHLLTVARRAGA
ncbi:uncharacterized protein LOC119278181 isoform X2 [Triticum dicoccoides]|uniref:uncharacterized protein LOC119278181 isoform X2 n=1 Tax=Triticum dicoccoides TaxID=85692 RepID=UPI00188DE0E0|nr:uncharacterized protein LOC119278181 isoform X2 [Triticum dicoccoides]